MGDSVKDRTGEVEIIASVFEDILESVRAYFSPEEISVLEEAKEFASTLWPDSVCKEQLEHAAEAPD